jgi:hypothetical protein
MILRIIARLAQNLFGQCNMKMQTAIKQIQKECDFMGLGFVEVLEDIQKHGKMLYCEKTMDAYQTVITNGQFFNESPIDIALYNKDMMEME